VLRLLRLLRGETLESPDLERVWTTELSTETKVDTARDEDAHGHQLEDDTGHHDVGSGLSRGARSGRSGGLATANSLKDEGDDVGGDEDDEVLRGE
jgi:hypothetical protein